MATSVGGINFNVGIDASSLTAELRAAITPAMASVQQTLNRKPLKVKFDLEDLGRHVDAAVSIQQAKLNQKPLKIKVKVELDSNIDAVQVAAIRQLGNISDKNIRIRVRIDISQAELDRLKAATPALRSIRALSDRDVRIRVRLDMSEAELERLKAIAPALRSLRGLSDRDVRIRIRIDVDEAQLMRIAALLRSIRSQTTNVRVNTDADSASSSITRLGSSLGGLAKFAGIAAAVTAGIAAIGGAAAVAAGAVGGLAAGLLALGPAAGAIGVTALVGLSGMKDAFTALGNVSQNAASESRSHAKAVASAQASLTSALEGTESAQRTLTSAQRTAAQASLDVGKAYREAERELERYQLRLEGASLSEREARLNLAEAQKELAQGKFTDPLDRERAILRVERAQLDLTEAELANQDLQAEAIEAQRKGVEGSDKVVAARDREAQAYEQVAEAQRGLAKANAEVAKAQTALAEAQNEALPSAQKFSDALAQLSPNAQAFVLAFRDIQPLLREFKNSIQDSLFAGLGDDLKVTAETVLPAVRDAMSGVAAELNLAARNALEFLRSARGIDGLNTAFTNTESLLRGMRSGTGEFTQGLLDIGTAAKPVMEDLGRSIASVFEGIGRAFTASKESGELTSVFEGLSQALQGVGSLLEGVTSAFLTIGNDVLPTLKPFFETLGGALKEIAPSLGQLGKAFVEALTPVIPELAILIRSLADGLRPVLPVISNLLITLGQAIQPLIKPFSDIAVIIGQTLVDTIKALQPALEPLATAFADILRAVAPLVPLFAESLSAVLVALAPAISQIANALAPVIKMFADQMKPVIEEIAPILSEVAATIGVALADALREIAPQLPDLVASFGDLLVAVLPLLPELVRLAVEVIPPLTQVMVDIIPVITNMIDAFTWFVENVITPVVIPAIGYLSDFFVSKFDAIAAQVHFITDTVLPKIPEALEAVKNAFTSAVSAIDTAWQRLADVMAVPINFVITTVLNNGLFKAWNTVGQFMGLAHIPDLPEIPRRAKGGPMFGPGTGTSDEILTWLSNGEHVLTAAEVIRAGGHNIVFAIRDMIARGIPFTWDGGKVIADLGKDNLSRYGAAVAKAGIGNVDPQGLFDSLAKGPIPQFQAGGPILPWMLQLQKGHDFARAQNNRPYKWAGPQFVGDSFDCSGFMGAIAAAILGLNPWQRYWSTQAFNGQQVGPQGFTKNQADGGFVVGITNGGPGGGHTAGVLGAIAELGYTAARVESGGALGDVHYDRGTDPRSFQMLYGLPIGANGFFQPGEGGGTVGPSTSDQLGFIGRTIKSVMDTAIGPVRELIKVVIGPPPPEVRRIPPSFLDATESAMALFLQDKANNLGDSIGGVWQAAQGIGGRVLDALNPFDTGGIATGTGILTKNTIEPERVLSPEQTRLFEALVESLQSIAGSPSAAVPNLLTADVFQQGITILAKNINDAQLRQQAATAVPDERPSDVEQKTAIQVLTEKIDGIVVTTRDLVLRSESSQDLARATEAAQIQSGFDQLAMMLTDQALIPIMESAVSEGIGILRKWLDASADQITAGTDRTTSAVLSTAGGGSGGAAAPFGAPGSAFDAVSAISDAVVSVANTARQAFESVANSIAQAALAQTPSKADPSKGRLGTDISGGTLVDTLVRLTGVEIDIRDTLIDTYEQILEFRGDLREAFDTSGRIVTDTAELMQRNESSRELVISETERINRALIKAVLKYLVLNVLLPIIQAILGAMITLATTAIGAAIGSMIPIIGTAIGAAVGAVIGAALAGLAAVFTSVLAVGAGAAIDAFDSGGVAVGVGMMPKNTIAPERVLSPRQTESFDRLVDVLDRTQGRGNVTINAPFTVLGGANAGATAHTDLLSLINGY